MRDPKRIDVMLVQLGRIWKKCPDMRLAQLVCNLLKYSDSMEPQLYWKLLEWMKDWENEFGATPSCTCMEDYSTEEDEGKRIDALRKLFNNKPIGDK